MNECIPSSNSAMWIEHDLRFLLIFTWTIWRMRKVINYCLNFLGCVLSIEDCQNHSIISENVFMVISGDSRQWSGGRDTPPALWRHRAAHTHTSWSACTTHTGIWGLRSYTGCSLHVPESSYTEWLKHKPRVRPPEQLTYDPPSQKNNTKNLFSINNTISK